jgi:nucleotide-binding universal stress UspA family protein
MEVFHAVSARREAPREAAAVPHAGGTAVERARSALKAAIAAAGTPGRQAAASVGFGRAAPSVLTRQRAIGAELLVIGKRQRGLFADYFLGGITQQVLAGSRSDVLVVPTRMPRGSTESAARAAGPQEGPRLHGRTAG